MKADSRNESKGAFTLIELLILFCVFALLAAIIVPAFISASHRVPKINCVNNLRQIELSFKTWAVDNGDKMPMELSVTNGGTRESALLGIAYPTFQVMSNELSSTRLTVCFTDKSRKVAANYGDLRTENVSYFVDVDITATNTEAILTGDRNLSLNDEAVKPGLISITTNSLAGWTSEIHRNQGNLGMGDGSVRQESVKGLREVLGQTGFATNRFAVP